MASSYSRLEKVKDRSGKEYVIPVDEDGYVPREALENRSANGRSLKGWLRDLGKNARKTYPNKVRPRQILPWWKNPGKFDVEGIDAMPGMATIPTKEYYDGEYMRPISIDPPKESPKKTVKAKTNVAKTKSAPKSRKTWIYGTFSPMGTVMGARIKEIAKTVEPLNDVIPVNLRTTFVIDDAHVSLAWLESDSNQSVMGLPIAENENDARYIDIVELASKVDKNVTYAISMDDEGVILSGGSGLIRAPFTKPNATIGQFKFPDFDAHGEIRDIKEFSRLAKQSGKVSGRTVLKQEIGDDDAIMVASNGTMAYRNESNKGLFMPDVFFERKFGSSEYPFKSSYPADYLAKLSQALDKDVGVEYYSGDSYPLSLEAKRDGYRLRYVIAPRIEEEGDI